MIVANQYFTYAHLPRDIQELIIEKLDSQSLSHLIKTGDRRVFFYYQHLLNRSDAPLTQLSNKSSARIFEILEIFKSSIRQFRLNFMYCHREPEFLNIHSNFFSSLDQYSSLQKLEIINNKSLKNPDLLSLSALTHLHTLTLKICPFLTSGLLLPNSLTSLSTDYTVSPFPPLLTTLEITGIHEVIESHLKNLPHSLTSLKITKELKSQISHWPHKLTLLSARFGPGYEDHFQTMPKGLLHLTFTQRKYFNSEDLQNIPPLLTFLKLDEIELSFEELAYLPRTLRHLTVTAETNQLLHLFPSHFPPHLLSLHMTTLHNFTAEEVKQLPRTLSSLSLMYWKPDSKSLKQLPVNLTQLIVGTLNSEDFALLPVSLKELGVYNKSSIQDQHFSLLPPDLTSLTLSSHDTLLDYSLVNFPTQLKNLFLHLLFSSEMIARLPQSLISLKIASETLLTEEDLKRLPKTLTSLECPLLPQAREHITPSWFESLPRTLTNLSIKDRSRSLKPAEIIPPPFLNHESRQLLKIYGFSLKKV